MKWNVGEIKQVNGEWYQCVVAMQGCRECSFRTQDCCTRHSECMSTERSDKTSVVFKKLEKIGEPYIKHDHSMNKDVVVQDYKLYNQHACYNGYEKILYFSLFDKDGIVTIKSKEPIKSLNCKNSVEIEIKQTKEDMEENKLNLKPFDIQKAREGKPVCTRDGRKARIICFDKIGKFPIVALIMDESNGELVYDYNEIGRDNNTIEKGYDLMMLPEKKEGWMNIYSNGYNHKVGALIYNSKEEALNNKESNAIDTVKIEWRE